MMQQQSRAQQSTLYLEVSSIQLAGLKVTCPFCTSEVAIEYIIKTDGQGHRHHGRCEGDLDMVDDYGPARWNSLNRQQARTFLYRHLALYFSRTARMTVPVWYIKEDKVKSQVDSSIRQVDTPANLGAQLYSFDTVERGGYIPHSTPAPAGSASQSPATPNPASIAQRPGPGTQQQDPFQSGHTSLSSQPQTRDHQGFYRYLQVSSSQLGRLTLKVACPLCQASRRISDLIGMEGHRRSCRLKDTSLALTTGGTNVWRTASTHIVRRSLFRTWGLFFTQTRVWSCTWYIRAELVSNPDASIPTVDIRHAPSARRYSFDNIMSDRQYAPQDATCQLPLLKFPASPAHSPRQGSSQLPSGRPAAAAATAAAANAPQTASRETSPARGRSDIRQTRIPSPPSGFRHADPKKQQLYEQQRGRQHSLGAALRRAFLGRT